MIFFDEKHQHLYACQHAWRDDEPVIRVLIPGHVDGEQFAADYTATKMHMLATRAEMIDIDKEITVDGTLYRLDMEGMRIKHKAQAAKTTTTKSGKATPGHLSWQTYKKFDELGDLAYAWYKLGQKLWFKMEPYVAPHRLDGAIIRPDADEPEVLPPIEADLAGHVERVRVLERTAQEALTTFAENVVRCGFELMTLKKKVGHGKWLKFFEQNLAHKGFQERHAQNYMKVAAAVRTKLGGSDAAAALLLAGEDGTEPAPEQQFEVIRETLSDMTDARTWNQLMMDFGLMRPSKTQGGNHGGGAASHRDAQIRHRLELDTSLDEWNRIIDMFRNFALRTHHCTLVPPPVLTEGLKSIGDCIVQVQKIIAKG